MKRIILFVAVFVTFLSLEAHSEISCEDLFEPVKVPPRVGGLYLVAVDTMRSQAAVALENARMQVRAAEGNLSERKQITLRNAEPPAPVVVELNRTVEALRDVREISKLSNEDIAILLAQAYEIQRDAVRYSTWILMTRSVRNGATASDALRMQVSDALTEMKWRLVSLARSRELLPSTVRSTMSVFYDGLASNSSGHHRKSWNLTKSAVLELYDADQKLLRP